MKLSVLCYVLDGDQVLMLHRNKKDKDYHKGKWNGLGGKFEAGESPEACLLREVVEESGLTLKVWDYEGVITFPNFDGKDDWYTFIYTANSFEGELRESEEGSLSWIPLKEMTELNLWDGDRIFLDWIFNKKEHFSAVFQYEEGKYVRHEVTFYE